MSDEPIPAGPQRRAAISKQSPIEEIAARIRAALQ